MTSYKLIPPTEEELKQWFENPNINPRTGKKISEQGSIYKVLKKYSKASSKKSSKIKEKVPKKEPKKEKVQKGKKKKYASDDSDTDSISDAEYIPKNGNKKSESKDNSQKEKKKKYASDDSDTDSISNAEYIPKNGNKINLDNDILKALLEKYLEEDIAGSKPVAKSDRKKVEQEKMELYNTDNDYLEFRKNRIDPLTHEKADPETAFIFPYKWNTYTGERLGIDENGPLYFDVTSLAQYFYSNRLNNLWEKVDSEPGTSYNSDDDIGYNETNYYGNAMGNGPDFNIKGRGLHPDWYLFRIPIIDCYLEKDHNIQVVTMGPILTDTELVEMDKLIKKSKKKKISLVRLKIIYEQAIAKEPILPFEKSVEPFVEPPDLLAYRTAANKTAINKLIHLYY